MVKSTYFGQQPDIEYMKFDTLPFNWFDIVLMIVLIMGILRGRKRGMSEELMTLLQWIVIVFVCSFAYRPLGAWLASVSVLTTLTCYMIAYTASAIVVALVFLLLKRLLNGKLIGSDVFGKGEYYLGMPAGMLRFFCVLLAILALMNAPYYTQEEIRAYKEYQLKNYDSEFFPGFQSLQANVFEKSLSGPFIQKQLAFLLIQPTRSEQKDIKTKEWQMPQ